jgi:ribosomal protein S17
MDKSVVVSVEKKLKALIYSKFVKTTSQIYGS